MFDETQAWRYPCDQWYCRVQATYSVIRNNHGGFYFDRQAVEVSHHDAMNVSSTKTYPSANGFSMFFFHIKCFSKRTPTRAQRAAAPYFLDHCRIACCTLYTVAICCLLPCGTCYLNNKAALPALYFWWFLRCLASFPSFLSSCRFMSFNCSFSSCGRHSKEVGSISALTRAPRAIE